MKEAREKMIQEASEKVIWTIGAKVCFGGVIRFAPVSIGEASNDKLFDYLDVGHGDTIELTDKIFGLPMLCKTSLIKEALEYGYIVK